MKFGTERKQKPESMGESAAGESRMALVVCADENLAWQAVFFLNRVLQFHGGSLDCFFYSNQPLPTELEKILSSDVNVVVKDKSVIPFEKFKTTRRFTLTSLLRITALEELCPKYVRVVYCDVDMFLRWGDLNELRNFDFEGKPMAAVRDAQYWSMSDCDVIRDADHLVAGQEQNYFNSGFLVANSKEFLSQGIAEKAVNFLMEHGKTLVYADQTALNYALSANWRELPPSWNWQMHKGDGFLAWAVNPRIVHFSGRNKPWNGALFLMDEYYSSAMEEFLKHNGLDTEAATLREAVWGNEFQPILLRRRARRSRSAVDRYEKIKEYLSRKDFATVW